MLYIENLNIFVLLKSCDNSLLLSAAFLVILTYCVKKSRRNVFCQMISVRFFHDQQQFGRSKSFSQKYSLNSCHGWETFLDKCQPSSSGTQESFEQSTRSLVLTNQWLRLSGWFKCLAQISLLNSLHTQKISTGTHTNAHIHTHTQRKHTYNKHTTLMSHYWSLDRPHPARGWSFSTMSSNEHENRTGCCYIK